MKAITVLLSLGLFVSGCGLGTAISQSRCESYGYDTNSDAYRDCVAEENRARRQRISRAYGY